MKYVFGVFLLYVRIMTLVFKIKLTCTLFVIELIHFINCLVNYYFLTLLITFFTIFLFKIVLLSHPLVKKNRILYNLVYNTSNLLVKINTLCMAKTNTGVSKSNLN